MVSALDALACNSAWSGRGSGGKASLSLLLLAVALGGPQPFAGPLAGGIAAGLLLAGARIPPKALLAFLLAPAGFLLTSLPLLMLSVGGGGSNGAIAGAGSWSLHIAWTTEGLAAAVQLCCRSLGAVCCLALLTLTTPAPRLLALGRRLGVPDAVSDIALLVYRLLFILAGVAAAGARAQDFRLGYRTRKTSLRSLSLLASGLFSRALHRALRMERGLAVRGYDGALPTLDLSPPTTRGQWLEAFCWPLLALGLSLLACQWLAEFVIPAGSLPAS